MGDTFSSFVKFISDDPIMLGLCIAIIFLVILFLIVLLAGKKKEKPESKDIDNTAELLKTEVNLEALESTKQYSSNELKAFEPVKETPVEPEIKMPDPQEQTQKEDAIKIPVEMPTSPTPLEANAPILPSVESASSIGDTDFRGADSLIDLTEPEAKTNTQQSDQATPFPDFAPAPEKPGFDFGFDVDRKENVFDAQETPLEPNVPSMNTFSTTAKINKVEIPEAEESKYYGSAYVDPEDVDLPEMNFDFDKSSIVDSFASTPTPTVNRTSAPIMPSVEEVKTPTDALDAMDDLDLPKLNTAPNTSSAFNSLKGESFDIK